MPRPSREAARASAPHTPRRPRTGARLLGLRRRTRGDRGQGAVEYVGITLVVAAIVGGLLLTGIGAPMADRFATAVCQVLGIDGCGAGGEPAAARGNGDAHQGDGASGGTGGPGATDPEAADPPTGPDATARDTPDPDRAAYEAAQRELAAAQAAYASDNEKAREAALALAKLLADELGITDAVACITEGDTSACTETLINVLSSLIGGAVGKLAAKYGAPWKWKQAAALVAELRKHGGELYDGLTGLVKNRKRVADAERALDRAGERYDPNAPVKPRRPDDDLSVACPAPMTGGRVRLGGGTRPPAVLGERPPTCKEFPSAPNVTGPAAGKTLKTPHPRHTVAGAKHGQVKPKNSVILKGREAEIDSDVKAIAEGRATFNTKTSRYEINGRSYGVEDTGRVYPDSGPGIVNLDRNEYAALKEIAKAGGDTSVPAITKNPRFSDPKVVEKAKQVYDGTYK
ncbi:hypothetical protein [Streptomyces sp. NPDC060194]|uniref:hypothetical protein n=1 Tax=Streptomyces sp. NPDC060194 TaxID=3347069 RepID=UPI0036515011